MDYKKLINKFLNKGYFERENFFTNKELIQLRKFVDKNLNKNKSKTFFLTSKSNNDIRDFFKNNEIIYKKIKLIIRNISNKLNIKDNENIYSVLRVIKCQRIKNESFRYHFDAHLLTILIPIYIPKRKNSNNGHLLISPNLRKISNSILINILQKIYYQKFLSKILNGSKLIKILKLQKIILKPKSIFVFNGFRSLHGNLDIHKDDLRATMLIHYHDIFKNSKLITFNRNLRILRENKRIKNNLHA